MPPRGLARRGMVASVTFEIKTAAELVDSGLEARWAERRAARFAAPLQSILCLFLERGGPVPLDRLAEPARSLVDELDARDLVLVREGSIELAYPFASGPNPFAVVLGDG